MIEEESIGGIRSQSLKAPEQSQSRFHVTCQVSSAHLNTFDIMCLQINKSESHSVVGHSLGPHGL